MTIPQVKNPWIGALIIFIGLPLLYYGHQYQAGEIHAWTDISLDSLNHRTFTSFWAAVFWIFFKSPWASQITELTNSASTTGPDGTSIEKKTSIKIEEPPK